MANVSQDVAEDHLDASKLLIELAGVYQALIGQVRLKMSHAHLTRILAKSNT